MAKFIRLTDVRRNDIFALNVDTIEYMIPIPDNGGTTIVTVTHHTKYVVKELMDDILSTIECPITVTDSLTFPYLNYTGDLIVPCGSTSAQETPPITEV